MTNAVDDCRTAARRPRWARWARRGYARVLGLSVLRGAASALGAAAVSRVLWLMEHRS